MYKYQEMTQNDKNRLAAAISHVAYFRSYAAILTLGCMERSWCVNDIGDRNYLYYGPRLNPMDTSEACAFFYSYNAEVFHFYLWFVKEAYVIKTEKVMTLPAPTAELKEDLLQALQVFVASTFGESRIKSEIRFEGIL